MNDPRKQFAIDTVRKLRDAGHEALWAGGCVRDLILGLNPSDYDIATNAVPQRVREVFGKKRTIPVGAAFGVIMVVGPKDAGTIEVATFRAEGEYSDGRRPDNVVFCTAEEDAHRRDFTINGMFYDPLTEQVHDYVGGQADLENRILRAIGDPHKRMEEDKLRMLRAVRFTARFDFALDQSTADAIRRMVDQITIVSWERIAEELRKMLAHPRRHHALELAAELGLPPRILPEIQPLTEHPDRWRHRLAVLAHMQSRSFELALAILLAELRETETAKRQHTAAYHVCRRMKLSNEETDHICWLIENQQALDEPAQLPLHDLKPILIHRHAAHLLEWMRIRDEVLGREPQAADWCETYLKKTPTEILNPEPLLNGQDLMALGIEPGPNYSQILDALRKRQLDEKIDTKAQAIGFVKEYLAD